MSSHKLRRIPCLVPSVFVMLLCAGVSVRGDDIDTRGLEREAQALAQELQQRLQAQLFTAVGIGGLAGALDACRINAPAVARELSVDGWQLRRTALRVRNPANTATQWERHQLEIMNEALGAGADPGALSVALIRHSEGGWRFYYMQPIIMGQRCLGCHGAGLSVEVKQALATLYPRDEATGFALGGLRGAFAFEKVLPEP